MHVEDTRKWRPISMTSWTKLFENLFMHCSESNNKVKKVLKYLIELLITAILIYRSSFYNNFSPLGCFVKFFFSPKTGKGCGPQTPPPLDLPLIYSQALESLLNGLLKKQHNSCVTKHTEILHCPTTWDR